MTRAINVPPLDELIILIYGRPGSGKTTLCQGGPETLFLATEPGADFIIGPKVVAVNNWKDFNKQLELLEAAKLKGDRSGSDVDYSGFTSCTIDIVDQLSEYCRNEVCARKGLEYPPMNDHGKTWAEITRLWKTSLHRLMCLCNVRFISHCNVSKIMVDKGNGLQTEIDYYRPTFSGNKPAQYLDGLVNAVGYMERDFDKTHTIRFDGSNAHATKDRTRILNKMGRITLPNDPDQAWAWLCDAYRQVATHLGYTVKSKWGTKDII